MLKRFHQDLARLTSESAPKGLRVRRQHDSRSRRTFASMAENASRDREGVKWIVHGRPGDVLGQYSEAEWERLCAVVKSVKVELLTGKVLELARGAI